MAHLHEVRDTDSHFIIDPITRAITNANSAKNTLMLGDHKSEVFTFEIPKEIEKHDMSLCNKIRIHYINIGANKANQSSDVYEVTDMAADETETDTLVFSWSPTDNATKYAGTLNFRIQFLCLDEDNNYTYKWHTDIFKGISIADGIDNSETVIADYSDVLEQWKSDLEALQSTEAIKNAVNTYMAENPFQESDPTVPDWAKQETKPTYTADEVGALPASTEIPTALPTPNKLTFSGAVAAEFDGSKAVDVEIPSGGEKYEYVEEVIAEGTLAVDSVGFIDTGLTFGDLKAYKEFYFILYGSENVALVGANGLLLNTATNYYGCQCILPIFAADGYIGRVKFENNCFSSEKISGTSYWARTHKVVAASILNPQGFSELQAVGRNFLYYKADSIDDSAPVNIFLANAITTEKIWLIKGVRKW